MPERARLVDYHTQTIEHGLAKPRRVRETVQAAVNAGLTTICLTDHFPLPPGLVDPTAEKDCAMPATDYPDYQQEVDETMREFGGRITVLRGAEVDWLPQHRSWITEQLAAWPFDYVIGSVHFLGRIIDDKGDRNLLLDYDEAEFQRGIDYYWGIQPLAVAYFQQVRGMVQSGLFDGVGHLDLVKKYDDRGLFSQDEPWYRRAVLETLDTIASSPMSIEINAAGLDKKCKEAYPAPWILQEARARNIPLTTGSDGHTPEGIGRNLNVAMELARAAGYNHIVEYRERRQVIVAI